MRVAVTGAGGFVGRAVTAALQERGHEAVAVVRRRLDELDDLDQRVADVAEPAALVAALNDVDGVCHLAALGRVRDSYKNPLGFWRTNLGGTLNVLAAASEHGRLNRLVLASSGSVYAEGDQPLDEDAQLAPNHPYGATKLAADLAVRDAAQSGLIGAVSLRAFNIAGAWGRQFDTDQSRLIPTALGVAAGSVAVLPVNGDGSAVRDYVHVRDAAEAFVRALDTCNPGQWRAYNLGASRASVADVISCVERTTGRPIAVEHRVPAPEAARLVADSSRAHEELGWQASRSSLDRIVGDAWTALTSRYAGAEYSSSD